MVVTYEDGSQGFKTMYCTFEYVKKHLKEFKACTCDACQATLASYRINKKSMRMLKRGATPEQIAALVPANWAREVEH
jgi:hypothetical protein